MAGLSAQDEYRAAAGDYAVTATADGFVVEHQGQPLTLGSYFTVFRPEYNGSVLTSARAWEEGAVVVSGDGRTIALEATMPEGSVGYSVEVSEKGLHVRASITVAEGVDIGAVEYAAFQIRPELIEGATVEVWDGAGSAIDYQAVPGAPKRGAFARTGTGLTFKTPDRQIIVSSSSPVGIYPFDARVGQYGAKQGVWVFTTIPAAAGAEAVSEIDLSVAPPRA
jgi:hypothetical protein